MFVVCCVATLCCILGVSGQYDYDQVLSKSILFYEAQRSGALPSTNRIPWRGDSALNDQGNSGEDLVGGWYDAGDNMKFGFPMSWTVTTLAYGLLEFRDAYETAQEYTNAVAGIRWPLEYLLKCHIRTNLFYGQVGITTVDWEWWGRPEDMPADMERPAFSLSDTAPGSDLAAEAAAAMAAGYLIFRESDPTFGFQLLDNARRLYQFAYTYRGLYNETITDASDYYGSTGYEDELAWAAVWLYRATGEPGYLDAALEFADSETVAEVYDWDDKTVGYQLLLFSIANQPTFQAPVQQFVRNWLPGGAVPYTPKGLAWITDYGSNAYAADASFIALVAAKYGVLSTEGRAFAQSQINYMLGDSGRSFVVGFGTNPPLRAIHPAASCPTDAATPCGWDDYDSPDPNPNVINGCLVGGPGIDDSYEDIRTNALQNECACDYNAGFQSAVAGLRSAQLASSRIRT